MKNLHKAKTPQQYPQFWNEEWLDVAIKELDTKKLTPEQRFAYEMTISKNAVILRNEEKKIKQAVQRNEMAVKIETIKNALSMGLTVEQAAKLANVSVDFVLSVRQ